jgi:hypothetical protein
MRPHTEDETYAAICLWALLAILPNVIESNHDNAATTGPRRTPDAARVGISSLRASSQPDSVEHTILRAPGPSPRKAPAKRG